MAYVKISDPSIIDLAAWHQVINVVNQHSDSLNNLTNNFGSAGTVDWSSVSFSHQFDSGSQAILFGRATSYHSDTATSNIYTNTVTFANATTGANAFSSIPVVTATCSAGTSFSTSNSDIVISLYNITSTGFSYRLYRPGTTKTLDGSGSNASLYVNWIAIGPR
jgi:hypothetical protein